MAKKKYIERMTFPAKPSPEKEDEGHRGNDKGKGSYDSKKKKADKE